MISHCSILFLLELGGFKFLMRLLLLRLFLNGFLRSYLTHHLNVQIINFWLNFISIQNLSFVSLIKLLL